MEHQNVMEVDVWVRGTNEATTQLLTNVSSESSTWTDGDVRTLLIEMLLALERARNPGGEVPSVTLRGFSWIVSAGAEGVLVHLELQTGAASAGPFVIAEQRLTEMIGRVMSGSATSPSVH
jgi:hypothetical protein